LTKQVSQRCVRSAIWPASNASAGAGGTRAHDVGAPSACPGEIRYHFILSPPYSGTARSVMDTQQRIKQIVDENAVVLFMKGTAQFPMCGFSGRAIQILKACGVDAPKTVNVLEDDEVRQGIKEFSNWPTIPQLYVKGEFIGGSDIMMEMYQNGELQQLFAAV
jgi:monothiol glutaredoxin